MDGKILQNQTGMQSEKQRLKGSYCWQGISEITGKRCFQSHEIKRQRLSEGTESKCETTEKTEGFKLFTISPSHKDPGIFCAHFNRKTAQRPDPGTAYMFRHREPEEIYPRLVKKLVKAMLGPAVILCDDSES